MESTPVNWEALDALLIDFAKSENLIEDSSALSPSSPSSSSYHSRLVIRQIRRAVETGAIDAAVALLRLHAPSILTDLKILFRLRKQKFIELLRKGTAEDRDSAIECLRTALAPCALDAYPEAYEEFKHVLLAFIYDKDDKTSPVANEWSEQRRLDLAGFMSSMLRAHLNAYDPIFSMALRYLISIHRVYCLRQGITSPISDLTERLLLEERDPSATPQDILYEVPPFDEVDIQALAHAVELTRQGAIDSLRFTKGDVVLAFQNELCRMRLDVPLLDQLVREYCVYRGIVDSEPVKINQQDPGYCSSRDCSLELDCNASKHSDGETSVTNAQMDGSPENNSDVTSMRRIDFEVRYASELASIHEDCSTSGSQQHEDASVLQRCRLSGNGERSKRKRWRGRYDGNSYMSDASLEENSKQEHSIGTVVSTILKEKQGSEKLSVHDINNVEDRYEILLGMKELASKGMAAEAVEEVNAIDSNFFAQNSILLFQLKQARFLVLAIEALCSTALPIHSTYLHLQVSSKVSVFGDCKEEITATLNRIEVQLLRVSRRGMTDSTILSLIWKLCLGKPEKKKIFGINLKAHTKYYWFLLIKGHQQHHGKVKAIQEWPTPKTVGSRKIEQETCQKGKSNVVADALSRRNGKDSIFVVVDSSLVTFEEHCGEVVLEPELLSSQDHIICLICYPNQIQSVIQIKSW
ncbi:hypothetical protein JHK87_012212 [Glycine soja]|nr:hypothetical protein JHK87_012212 [Glycine soja]